jgi:hypothetical protein
MERHNFILATLEHSDHAVRTVYQLSTIDNTYAHQVYLCVPREPTVEAEKDDADFG